MFFSFYDHKLVLDIFVYNHSMTSVESQISRIDMITAMYATCANQESR